MKSIYRPRFSLGAFTLSVVCLLIVLCATPLILKSQSNAQQHTAISELKLKPTPTRVYENSTADCWIVLTPSGYWSAPIWYTSGYIRDPAFIVAYSVGAL